MKKSIPELMEEIRKGERTLKHICEDYGLNYDATRQKLYRYKKKQPTTNDKKDNQKRTKKVTSIFENFKLEDLVSFAEMKAKENPKNLTYHEFKIRGIHDGQRRSRSFSIVKDAIDITVEYLKELHKNPKLLQEMKEKMPELETKKIKMGEIKLLTHLKNMKISETMKRGNLFAIEALYQEIEKISCHTEEEINDFLYDLFFSGSLDIQMGSVPENFRSVITPSKNSLTWASWIN